MNDETGPHEERSPAERRLDEHLELMRVVGPEPGRGLVRRIVRTARWQRAVRAPLLVVGMLAAAAAEGLLRLLGSDARRRRWP